MKSKKITSVSILAFLMIFTCYIPSNASSVTWDDTVNVDEWVKYDVSIHIDIKILQFITIANLNYYSKAKLSISSVNSSEVEFDVLEVDGTLSNFTVNEAGEFFLPSEMLILPREMIDIDTLDIGSISISFVNETESDYTKFWRGSHVKKVVMDDDVLESIGIISFLEFLPVDIINLIAFVKYEAFTGWLMQLNLFALVQLKILNLVFDGEITFDVSMIDASESVKTSILENVDHSMDATFLSDDVFRNPWFLVLLFCIGISIFIVFVFLYKRKKAPKTRPIIKDDTKTGKKTKKTNISNQYRSKHK